jgi:hypothetical protein
VSQGRSRSRGFTKNLENAIDEVHDPVIREASAGVGGGLALTGRGQPREGDLDDQCRPIVEDHGTLGLDEPAFAEGPLQRLLQQEIVEELDGVILVESRWRSGARTRPGSSGAGRRAPSASSPAS